MYMAMIPTNSTRLHVAVHEPNGAPVIFLHFGMHHLAVWNSVIPFFKPNYQVIAVDLRGHGHSDKPADGYSHANMARDLLGVMDHLGIERAHFVGSSMGSEVAVRLAADYPDRVISLALEGLVQNAFGPHGSYPVEPSQVEAKKAEMRAARAVRPPLVAETAEALLETLITRWGRTLGENPAFDAAIRYNIVQREDGRFGVLASPAGQDAYMEAFWEARFDQDFARITCPVLFLPDQPSFQEEDGRASMEWFCSLLGDAAIAVIPGSTHAGVILDQPEAFAEAVLNFHRRL